MRDRFGRDLVGIGEVHDAYGAPTLQAVSRLAAGDCLFQHDRLEAFGCGIDRGGETRRSRSDVVDAPTDGLR